MSYQSVSHVSHESYAPPGPPPPGGFYESEPPLPPRPLGYQGYLGGGDPRPASRHHVGPAGPASQGFDYQYENRCFSLLRGCLATLCCCWILERCCYW